MCNKKAMLSSSCFSLAFSSIFKHLVNSYSIPGTEDNKDDKVKSLSSINCILSLGDRLLSNSSRGVYKMLGTGGGGPY